jgi:hypothetical protein
LHPTYLLIYQIVRIGRVQGCNLQESLTGVNGELRAVMTEVLARTSIISLFDWDLAHIFEIAVTGTACTRGRVPGSRLQSSVFRKVRAFGLSR